jgi:TolB-like protein/DNA-binding winged helix-turn-helix (wHTH) protein
MYFDGWVLDVDLRELTKDGRRIVLQDQPLQVLCELLAHPGELVTREQLIARLWPRQVVDFDTGLNSAVRKLRIALQDEADSARYIETVPRKGYRFVGTIDPSPDEQSVVRLPAATRAPDEMRSPERGSSEAGVAPEETSGQASRARWYGRRSYLSVAPGAVLLLLAGLTLAVLAVSWTIAHYRGASKLSALTSPTTPLPIHSLVVLPLENLSGDKEQEYFADGMTDELITNLAQIGSLRVISRTSAMHFKGSRQTLPQIGHDLQVDAVVEGTVTRGENRVRITAQLIEASTDHHLWARTYVRDLKNVLALQDEIAQDITQEIRVKLTPSERSQLVQVHSVDPEAYDDFLRGRYWLHSPTGEGAWKALDYFQKATAKDPQYALAYAGVADSFLELAFSDVGEHVHRLAALLPRKEAFPKAREAAAKALVLDPSLAEAHTALATLKLYMDWDWPGAEHEFKQALSLNPNYAVARNGYSNYLVAMGRLDEAIKEIEHARDIDPLSVDITFWLGQVLYHARRYDDALRQDLRGLEMLPDDSAFYGAMADVYEQKKMFAEAFAARQQALRLENDPKVAALGEAYKRSGFKGYLSKVAQLLQQPYDPAYAAHVYALLQDEPHAMTALEVAYNERNPGILFMRTAPEFDSIRSSPRFRDLVRRIGFPPSPSNSN